MTKEKYLILFKEYLHKEYKDSSTNAYCFIVSRFLTHYPCPLNLSMQDIVNYLADMQQENVTDMYRSVNLLAIKKFFNMLFYNEMISFHPCYNLQISGRKKSGINFAMLYTMPQMEKMLKQIKGYSEAIEIRDKLLFSFFIYQGITLGECIKLKIDNIDLNEGVLKITKTYLVPRTICLHPAQSVLGYRYLTECREKLSKSAANDALFLSKDGTHLTTSGVYSIFKRLARNTNTVDISPMKIRKSVISYWTNIRKFKLLDVQIMAGHTMPSTTERYYDKNDEKMRRIIEKKHPINFM
jgi:integrase/recombinase XerD